MIQLNDFGNCVTDYLGSGLGQCDRNKLGDLRGFALLKKGWKKVIATDSFNLAEWIIDVKKLDAFPYLDIQGFTQDTPTNELNTSDLGIIQEVRAGKPQFSFMFAKGSCFHKSLYNKKGNGLWDIALIFESGILLATNRAKTELKGFDGGAFIIETYKFQQGTDLEMSTATIQLLNPEEFNSRNTFFPFEKVGDLDSIKGAIEVAISINAIAPLDDTFTAKITSACNTGSPILGLETADFVLGGGQATPNAITAVTYNASTGLYTFELNSALASADTVSVKLSDGTYDVIEDVSGNLLKGTSNTVIVS